MTATRRVEMLNWGELAGRCLRAGVPEDLLDELVDRLQLKDDVMVKIITPMGWGCIGYGIWSLYRPGPLWLWYVVRGHGHFILEPLPEDLERRPWSFSSDETDRLGVTR